MLGVECTFCNTGFNKTVRLPRFLVCSGKTICSECLSYLLDSSKKRCPCCLKLFKKDRLQDYPVNVALVENLELAKFISREDYNQKSRQQLKKTTRNIYSVKPTIQTLLDSIEKSVKNVEVAQGLLEASMETSCNLDEMFGAKLKALKERYNNCRRQMPEIVVVVRDVGIKSSSYKSGLSFLIRIKTVLTGGLKIAALMVIHGTRSRAKVSLKDNLLRVHAFEEDLETGSINTVCFQDLQGILLGSAIANAVYGFLEVKHKKKGPTKTFVVKISETNSYLGTQFLKLCSGELGFSYKGHSFSQEEDLGFKYFVKVCGFKWDMFELHNYTKYFVDKAPIKVVCDLENSYLRFEHDGSFDIFKCKDQALTYDRVVGQVVNLPDLESIFGDSADACTIVDCGIAYEF